MALVGQGQTDVGVTLKIPDGHKQVMRFSVLLILIRCITLYTGV